MNYSWVCRDINFDLIGIVRILDAKVERMRKIDLIKRKELDVLKYEDSTTRKYLTIKLKEIEMKLELGFSLDNIKNEIVADIKYWNNKIMEGINND